MLTSGAALPGRATCPHLLPEDVSGSRGSSVIAWAELNGQLEWMHQQHCASLDFTLFAQLWDIRQQKRCQFTLQRRMNTPGSRGWRAACKHRRSPHPSPGGTSFWFQGPPVGHSVPPLWMKKRLLLPDERLGWSSSDWVNTGFCKCLPLGPWALLAAGEGSQLHPEGSSTRQTTWRPKQSQRGPVQMLACTQNIN